MPGLPELERKPLREDDDQRSGDGRFSTLDELSTHLSIRLATSDDGEWCWQHDYASAEHLRHAIDEERILLAINGTEVVGMLRGTWLHDATPMLALIYVESPARRLGVARQLLARWCAHFTDAGHSFCLSSGTDGEELSARWHHGCGFERCGVIERFNEDGTDELLYRLDLE